ncbi:MAG: pilus assembly protein [Burkholderiaceae bacterium]
MKRLSLPRAARRQTGAALVVGLILLVVLTLLGVSAYLIASQQERMAGNTRDRIRAFEAAETALRDCESVLARTGGLPTFDGNGGMYTAPDVDQPQLFQTVDWSNDAAVRVLAKPLADVARQPRCIVERVIDIEVRPDGGAVSGPQAMELATVYRTTATGYGIQLSSQAQVQSTYRR